MEPNAPSPALAEKRITLLEPEQKRALWGEGPWVNEADRIEFEAHGLPALMTRHEDSGHWCGYVAVPPGHPLHGKGPSVTFGLRGHRGVNYAKACDQRVCHVPKPGEPDNVWWFGFDCWHHDDLSPGMLTMFPSCLLPKDMQYRDEAYVHERVVGLARQLAEWPAM